MNEDWDDGGHNQGRLGHLGVTIAHVNDSLVGGASNASVDIRVFVDEEQDEEEHGRAYLEAQSIGQYTCKCPNEAKLSEDSTQEPGK